MSFTHPLSKRKAIDFPVVLVIFYHIQEWSESSWGSRNSPFSIDWDLTLGPWEQFFTVEHQFIFIPLQNKPLFGCYDVGDTTFLIREWFPTSTSSSVKIIYNSSWEVKVVYMGCFSQVHSSGCYIRWDKKIASFSSHFLYSRMNIRWKPPPYQELLFNHP